MVTLPVKREALGTTYAAIAVTKSLGKMVTGPLVAAAFRRGLWLGLPFLLAAGLYGVAFGAVSLAGWRDTRWDE